MLTAADEAILAQQDFVALATAWGTLNCWGWPDWLPEPEPAFMTGGRRSQIMRWIEEAVGMRACYRYSAPHRNTTEEEFNDFWRACFEKHEPSKARYWKRLEKRARELGLK